LGCWVRSGVSQSLLSKEAGGEGDEGGLTSRTREGKERRRKRKRLTSTPITRLNNNSSVIGITNGRQASRRTLPWMNNFPRRSWSSRRRGGGGSGRGGGSGGDTSPVDDLPLLVRTIGAIPNLGLSNTNAECQSVSQSRSNGKGRIERGELTGFPFVVLPPVLSKHFPVPSSCILPLPVPGLVTHC
jgi:hypothetical protein